MTPSTRSHAPGRRMANWRIVLLVLFGLLAAVGAGHATASAQGSHDVSFVARLTESGGQPVESATILLLLDGRPAVAAVHASASDDRGDVTVRFSLSEAQVACIVDGGCQVGVRIEAAHFRTLTWEAGREHLLTGDSQVVIVAGNIALQRTYGPAFWLAVAVFAGTIAVIVFERLHRTTAALLGSGVILVVTHTVGHYVPQWQALSFEQAIHYVDLEVVFLLLGMMIIISVLENTGLFQWFTYRAYRISGGRPWLLAVLLMLVTAVLSAMLDNVTTILLVSPITIEIALQMGMNPLALLVPEVMACNVGGAATLIGDPPNILIGSYTGLTFNDFLTNMAPGVLMALAVVIPMTVLIYARQYRRARGSRSPALEKRLAANAGISDPVLLRRCLIVFAVTLSGFFLGSAIELPPAVPALFGAALLLAWTQPDLGRTLARIDWMTILFFIGLFIQVGALQEVGGLTMVASAASALVGTNLPFAIVLVLLLTLVTSAVIDNIPFTAAMLPVVASMVARMPSQPMVLYWALAFGACFGGNGTLIGASANLVVAGYAERAGYPLSYSGYLRVGLPVALASGLVAAVWLLARL
ncbi:MAG: ArsB/NhaD family transporter [Anaerolineae bacterium]